MTEGLFILTTIFVAYVVYAIIGDQKTAAKSKAPAAAAKPEAQAQPAAVEQPKPQLVVAEAKPAPSKPAATKTATAKATKAAAAKPAATKTKAAKPAAAKKAAAVATKSAGLKDPQTGEVVSAYSNYRFTKRWIKDALVAEGLLEKVYTSSELNSDTEAKIKEALGKLEAMDKYKV